MIDYCVTNQQIHPKNIIDIRTLSSAIIGSDYRLVLVKLDLETKIATFKEPQIIKEKFIIESL